MDNGLTYFELVLIRNEIGSKSYQQIADILSKPLQEITEAADTIAKLNSIITYQSIIDGKTKSDATKERRARQSKLLPDRVIGREIKKNQEINRRRRNEPQYQTKQINIGEMQRVIIDAKTVIYIKPGQNPTEERKRYLERYQKQREESLGIKPIYEKQRELGHFEKRKL